MTNDSKPSGKDLLMALNFVRSLVKSHEASKDAPMILQDVQRQNLAKYAPMLIGLLQDMTVQNWGIKNEQ